MGVKQATYHGFTGKELEEKGFAVSDELIKQDRDMHRLLNEMEEDILE